MSQRKKALIIVENSYVPLDVRVRYESETLRDAGWEVVVICPAPTGNYAMEIAQYKTNESVDLDGISVYYFPLTMAKDGVFGYSIEYLTAFFMIGRLSWRVWRDGHFDVFHICNPPDIFFPLALWYRLLGVRIVFDHHDLFPEFVNHRYRGISGRLLFAMALVMEYLTFRVANIIITVNESYRKIALTRGHMSAECVIVVRNGPKKEEFLPVEPAITLKKGFPYLACYVGVMGYEDGILEVVESLRYIVNELGRRDILLALVGDGSVRSQAQQSIQAWGLEQYVDMPGMITDKYIIRQYLSTSDVCLSPEPLTPLNNKSTFIKVGEYMAMGKPIVAFDLEETRYTAQEAAVYVESGDIDGFGQAIVDLLDDPVRRKRIGEFGRQRIMNQLSWENQKKLLLRAYEITLKGK